MRTYLRGSRARAPAALAYIQIRQHTSAYVCTSEAVGHVCPQHSRIYRYVSIRQHAYIPQRQWGTCVRSTCVYTDTSAYVSIRIYPRGSRARVSAALAYIQICQHTSAYVYTSEAVGHMCPQHFSDLSIGFIIAPAQHTSAYVSIRQHMYMQIRQHTSA
jgi:hypothetical protein